MGKNYLVYLKEMKCMMWKMCPNEYFFCLKQGFTVNPRASFELIHHNPLVSTFKLLGLQVCTSMLNWTYTFTPLKFMYPLYDLAINLPVSKMPPKHYFSLGVRNSQKYVRILTVNSTL